MSIKDAKQRQELVKELHLLKTDIFMEMVESGMMPLRPGVSRLVGGHFHSTLQKSCKQLPVSWAGVPTQATPSSKCSIAGILEKLLQLLSVYFAAGEAIAKSVPVAVCSTSNERAVSTIVRVLLGPEVEAKMRVFAGDVVKAKKPSPDIYNLAAETLKVDPSK